MTETRALLVATLPALLAVALVFLITGASLATLPLYIHGQLGFGAGVVGAVAGAQFVSAVLSRLWSGRMADAKGPKAAMLVGLGLTLAAGVFYLGSAAMAGAPLWGAGQPGDGAGSAGRRRELSSSRRGKAGGWLWRGKTGRRR